MLPTNSRAERLSPQKMSQLFDPALMPEEYYDGVNATSSF